MHDDPFSIDAGEDGGERPAPARNYHYQPCACCGEILLVVDSPLNRWLRDKIECATCLDKKGGRFSKGTPEDREKRLKGFLGMFGET